MGRSGDLANPIVQGVCDEKIPGSIYGDTSGFIQRRGTRRPPVAKPSGSSARHSGDDAAGRHLPYPAVACVRVEKIPGRIHGNTVGSVQRRRNRRPAVTGEVKGSVARDRGDDAAGRYFPYPIVATVRDEENSGSVQGDAPGQGQLRRNRRSPVTAEAYRFIASPRKSGHYAAGRHLPYPKVTVGDEEVPRRIHGDTVGTGRHRSRGPG